MSDSSNFNQEAGKASISSTTSDDIQGKLLEAYRLGFLDSGQRLLSSFDSVGVRSKLVNFIAFTILSVICTGAFFVPEDKPGSETYFFYVKSIRPIDVVLWSAITVTSIVSIVSLYRYLQGNASLKKKRQEEQASEVDLNEKLSKVAGIAEAKKPTLAERREFEMLSYYNSTVGSLENEKRATIRNSNVNLTFGIIISLIGVFVLATAIFYAGSNTHSGQQDRLIAMYLFISKIALSLFAELFAFFFLRLYSKNLDDVKYLTNEMTNVKMKMIALTCSFGESLNNITEDILREFAITERNFVLKKGESTIDNQRSKIDADGQTKLIDSITEFAKKIK
jgi:hypothetical protein